MDTGTSPYSNPVPEGHVRVVSRCLTYWADVEIDAVRQSGTLSRMLTADYRDSSNGDSILPVLMTRERTDRCVTLSELSAPVLAEVVHYLVADHDTTRTTHGTLGDGDTVKTVYEAYEPDPDYVMETMVAAAYLDLPALVSLCAALIAQHFESLSTFGDLPEDLVRAVLLHLDTPSLCRAEMIMRLSDRKLATGNLWYKKCEDLNLTLDGYPPASREARRWCIRHHLEQLVGSADYGDQEDVEQVLNAFQFLGKMVHAFKFKTAAIRDPKLLHTLVNLLPNLQELDCARAGIGHHGALALSRALVGKFLFSSLSLERNGIGPEGIRFLATSMSSSERVRQLAVSQVVREQDRGAMSLSVPSGRRSDAATSPRLQTLGVVSQRAPAKELESPVSSPRRTGDPRDPLLAARRVRPADVTVTPRERDTGGISGTSGNTSRDMGSQRSDLRESAQRPLGHIPSSSRSPALSPSHSVGADTLPSPRFTTRISRHSTQPHTPVVVTPVPQRRSTTGMVQPSSPRRLRGGHERPAAVPEMRVEQPATRNKERRRTQPVYPPPVSASVRPTQLLALDLSGNSVGDAALATLASSLTGSTSLTALNLSHNPIGEVGGLALAKLLRHQDQLETLRCNHAGLGTVALEALINAICDDQTITHVELASNIGSWSGKSAPPWRSVTDLTSAVSRMLRDNKILRGLALGYTPFGDQGAAQLGSALKHNTSLTSLSLQSIGIGEDGALALAKGIVRGCTALTHADFSWNMLDNGADAIFAAALAQSTSLVSLDLGYNACCPSDAAAIARALDVNRRVTRLDLQHPTEDPSWLYDDTRMTNDGCIIIAKALPTSPCLTYLNLSNHAIRCSGFITLARYLENSVLSTIVVKDNLIARDGALYLCKVVKSIFTRRGGPQDSSKDLADRAYTRTLLVLLDGNPLTRVGMEMVRVVAREYDGFTCSLLQCTGGED